MAALLVLATSAYSSPAQGIIASGVVSGSGSGPYTYSLSFSDGAGATSSIGYIWYAWTPGNFYLPSAPSSPVAPSGWTANVSGNSVQFSANSSANYITAGSTLSGFSYQASFTPSQLATQPNGGLSVAYAAGVFSSPSENFTVSGPAVPEPSTLTLALCCAAGLLPRLRKR
ncbi:MAG: hypothetical protein C5B50_25050 [Verrucomicrobia bacterium]|nr:MAG: hypothetical protein C5B50_25050 [Verrucomicrobiota bacterium]